MTILSTISPRAHAAPESGIVEVVNYARGREGLLPLWVGEGDLPTPAFISDAAREALSRRMYTWVASSLLDDPAAQQRLTELWARLGEAIQ